MKGLGAAKDTLERQMPYFVEICPEMGACRTASINLQLDHALRIENPDFTTPRIPWGGLPGERFSFLKIALEGPLGGSRHPAWIYIPHDSPHFYNLFQIEVITKPIDGISYGTACQVHIPRDHRKFPLIIV